MRKALAGVMLVGMLGVVGAAGGTSSKPQAREPAWVVAQGRVVLHRLFGDAKPRHTDYISYPKKIAVVFEFDHVVVCGPCSSPTDSSRARGRVFRTGFNRSTHRVGDELRFCTTRRACLYH